LVWLCIYRARLISEIESHFQYGKDDAKSKKANMAYANYKFYIGFLNLKGVRKS